MNSTAAVVISAPTIFINSQPRPDLNIGLVSCTVDQDFARPACCRLLLSNWQAGAYAFFDDEHLVHGAQLTVLMGDSVTLFDGVIDAIGGLYPAGEPPQLQVRAYDALERLRRRRVSRRFENLHGLDVLTMIAADHGLSVVPQLGGGLVTYASLTQANQTDLAFCYSLARDMDACLFVQDGQIMVRSRGAGDPAPVVLEYGHDLISFSCDANLSAQTSSVSVHGWDPQAAEPIGEEDTGGAISAELGGHRSGFAIAQDTYGGRIERLVHTVPSDTDAARATAAAHFGERARQFVTGRGVCNGDSQLRVGRRVNLGGLGALFDGHYALLATTHSFDQTHGYRTEFSVGRPDLGNPALL